MLSVRDKSQGTVAVRLRCCGLFSYQLTMYLLLSLVVEKKLKLVNTWQNYRQPMTDRNCICFLLCYYTDYV